MENLKAGARVLHSGTEKVIDEIHGDVIILNDKTCVRLEEISLIVESAAPVAPETNSEQSSELADIAAHERVALRTHIEELNEEAAAVSVFALMQEVDSSITVATLQEMTVEAMKKKLLHIAVTTGKIDPKKCGECGQIVPE
jgi:hypothetical protein